MPEIKVTGVEEKDIPDYADIIRGEMGYSHEEAVAYLREKNLGHMLMISVDGEAVGFLNYSRKGDACYIDDLDVAESGRRCGYGTLLLQHLERADGTSDARIWLHVNEENEDARKFFARNGYRTAGRVENYYAEGCHAIVYEKTAPGLPDSD